MMKSAKKKPVHTHNLRSRKREEIKYGCPICFKSYYKVELVRHPDTGASVCENCCPDRSRKKKEDDSAGWFVLGVEPGREGKVKKAIIRQAKIEQKTHLIKRIIIARKFEEAVVGKKGIILDYGEEPSRADAFLVARRKLMSFLKEEFTEDHPGYRYIVFRSRSEERGRESNNWTWQIKTVPEEKERRTLQVKKYPGYLICNIVYDADMKRIIDRTPNQWGLLLQPVHVNHLVEVKFSKKRGGWVYKVRVPAETVKERTVVAEGGPFLERETARAHGQQAKAKVEEFKPTGLESKEAAEILIAQKTFNQISKDPEERDKAVVQFRVGSEVLAIEGQFKGTRGKVLKINKVDKTQVEARVEISVMGCPLQVDIPFWNLQTVNY